MLFAGVLLLLFVTASSAQYRPVEKKSSVIFGVKNFGVRVGGSFSGLQGTIDFSKNDPEHAHVELSVDAKTVSTGNELRDDHLRGEDFFDVSKYPVLHFTSTAVTRGNDGVLLMTGRLTMKGVTKSVSFPFTVAPAASGYMFKAAFAINRKDFGVGDSAVISDEVQVTVELATEKTE
jgi:polyisoprenoid-binding protein YceI